VEPLELPTPHGPARVHLQPVREPRAALLLGHGAGGGVTARDLVAAAAAAQAAGVSVGLVEQPYRVAGRRSTPRAPLLDEAWLALVEGLRAGPLAGLPLVFGGRSSGARVACRTAAPAGAIGALCLAFPLKPPGRATAVSRLSELDDAGVPVLVVQGERDPYGMPPPGEGRTVVQVAGDHTLRSDLASLGAAVRAWLGQLVSTI
jgi:predicted alpha/beta-hydrolase family hydrolase